MSASPNFAATPKTAGVTLVNGDGTSIKDFVTAGANGSRIDMIGAATDETAARDVKLYVQISGADYLIGTVGVPIGAGNSGTVPAVNMLSRSNMAWLNDEGALILAANLKLRVAAGAAVTAAKTIWLAAQLADF